MGTNFWELLQQRQGQLTRSGHAVADYLLQHADEAQYLSISSLARECNVAEATVFRFCRALGFDGYHEMRIALAQANATGTMSSQRELQPGASTETLFEHASARLFTAINGTQNALSAEAVDEAARMLREAKQVFCFGQGGSMLLANDICARFASLSTKFRTSGDSHLQLLTSSLMNEADVVLFVSYSGATRDMMETLRTAKAAGAKIILLTHYEDSPGASLADVVLRCGAQESPLDSGSIPIKVAVLYVGEVLVLRYILDSPEQANTAQELTSEVLTLKML
ncbi:MurR/RpiR family transcriptional regulator [Faecalibacterium sp. CLA-AA-H233]|uniref:MurR/RpiR family transcriptional regulator n=1 Tax=Faecalibacterium butyricigenerans TaxID=1851427 RepID=A0ABS8F5D0_9FIRM|nr:MurR/RpiR family transcriptional regulator [Faecalibacterium sp. CLA-AA-H233]MCC2198409.1 MurR/RpiR family transcriptional regulator [Faecalibacterium sp. CLA-AA-H233]